MNTISLKPASLGSISSGTLRDEDLLSAFIFTLEDLRTVNSNFLSLPENRQLRDHIARTIGEAQDCFSEDGKTISEYWRDTAAAMINEDFVDLFMAFAPAYCFFGSHPGDGADFGFWPCMEQVEELPTVEDSDGARELGEDCKSVNDHGNVTVYGADGSVLLELV